MWRFLRPDASAVLGDAKAKRSLSRYFDVVRDKRYAKFVIAKRNPADFDGGLADSDLWLLHEQLTKEYQDLEGRIDGGKVNVGELPLPENSYLDLKIELARRIIGACHLCEKRCGVDRLHGEVGLYCRTGDQMLVSTIFTHMGEEVPLTPSGTVFTLGCTIRCLHCQNWSISQWYESGDAYQPKRMAREIERLRREGCRNANLVGGEPTPYLPQWLETFKHVRVNIPVVWNSNSYYSEETAKLLAGFVDVYLLDFKYGNDRCAERISSAPGYWEACTRNHLYAKKYGELLIRVLVLPEHLDCCLKPIVDWIAKNLGPDIRVNIMWQYRPEWRAHEIPELRRRLNAEERVRSIEIAEKAGLRNLEPH
ncbi:MAG: radical SAM protein [Candidatus Bathyarchaeia archaeon]